MSRNQQNKINALLLLSIFILACIIYFKNLSPSNNLQSLINSGLSAQQATQIQFTIAKKQFSLVKTPSKQWQIVDPLPINALNNRVERLLEILNYAYSSSFLISNINLKTLGLSPAKATLTINNETFIFGDTAPISAERYVMYKNTVYLTKDLVYPLMDSRIQGLADMSLLPQGVDVIGIKTPFIDIYKKEANWYKQGNNKITIKNNLVETWTQLKAIGVTKADGKKSLAELTIISNKAKYDFSIIQYQPLLILKPKGINLHYLFSKEHINSILK